MPWCSYCRELSSVLQNSEEMLFANYTNVSAVVNLRDVVAFAEVDCERDPGVCAEHLPPKQRFPTVVLFHRGHQMLTYTGRREAQDIASFVASYLDSMAKFGVLPHSMFRLLRNLRTPALLNAIGGLALAISGTRSFLRFTFALAAFSAVWCTWLVGCFFLGTMLPTATAICLIGLIASKLGARQPSTAVTTPSAWPTDQQHALAASGACVGDRGESNTDTRELEPRVELEPELQPKSERHSGLRGLALT